MWQRVYNSDYAVTLSSLPDLKSYPISSDNTQITLDSTSKEVTYGDSITLKASVSSGTPQTVTWKSSNTAVATVKNGVVTATGKGTAKITASLPNGRSAVCTVKVTTKSFQHQAIPMQALHSTQAVQLFLQSLLRTEAKFSVRTLTIV